MLLPFIQLGFNWWIGIPLLCLIIILISLDFGNFFNLNFGTFSLLASAIILATAINSSGDPRDILRALRELLVFLLMLVALSPIEFKPRKFIPEKAIKILCIVSLSIFLLTLFQFFAIRLGSTLLLPESWYPRKLFTPTALDFKYSLIRPSATFTEPSYLGLFAFATLTIGVFLRRSHSGANFLVYISAATIILSQSKSGIFFSILLFLVLIVTKLRNRSIDSVKVSTVIMLATILGFSLFVSNFARISDSTSVRDRITIPARIGFDVFLTNPFGIPYRRRLEMPVLQVENVNWFALSHNGLLNLIFDYGILGLLVVIVLAVNLRNKGLLFLLIIYLGIQNGSFLDFDKAVITLFVVVFLRSCKGYPNLEIPRAGKMT